MMANTFEMMAAMGISREVYEYGERVRIWAWFSIIGM